MATFKATKYKNTLGSTFKATKKKSYDTTMTYTWESKNKESASKLNDYSSRVNDGGFLSADDLTDYKKSLDSYVDSSTRLRDLSMSLGKTYTDEENAEWDKQLTALNTLYDQARDYYSQWENEDAYKQAVEAQKAYENTLAMDLPSAWEEVDSLKNRLADLNQQLEDHRVTYGQMTGYSQEMADKDSALDTEIRQLNDLIVEREAYLTRVGRTQEGAKMAAVANPESELYDPDFAKYSGYSSTKQDGLFAKMSSKYGMGYSDLVYEYINGANNGMRQDILSSATSWTADNRLNEYSLYIIYDEMTPEQVSIYNYYYAKEGKEAADKYLDNIADALNFSNAQKDFEKLRGKPVAEALYGIVSGAEQASQGLKNLFSNEDYIPTTSTQYLGSMAREDLGTVGKFAYDFLSTASNMAPSILTSAVIGQLNPTAGVIAGNAMMGASAAGNAYQQALSMGYNKTQSRVYSTMVGTAEVGMQYALGGIGKLGGKLSGKAIQMLNGIDNAIFRVAGKVGASALSEGVEEGLTEIVDTWIGNMVLHMDEDINWEEVAYSTLLGAVSGGVMNVGDIAKSESAIQKLGQVIDKSGVSTDAEEIKAFINEGLEAPEDSEAYQIAEHLQQKQASGKEISGQELARLLMENERVIQAEEAKTKAASDSSGLNLAKQVIAGDLGENGTQLMERVYREAEDAGIDTSKTDFARGFLSYYNAGFTDNSVENVKWSGSGLKTWQKAAIWKAGRQDAIASLQKAQKGKFVTYSGKNAGLVKNQYSDALQKTNPGVFVAADKLGKQLGTRVEIKPLEDGVNGNIQDGVVTLNSKLLGKQNVEEVFLGTLAHEAFHRMMEVAPTEARAFRDYVAKVYASRGSLEGTVSTYIQGYSGKQTLTNEGALEEAAADYIKKFVKDTKLFSDAMKQPENQSWGRKFMESVKALIAKIKKVFTDQDARNAASIEATGKNLSEVEQAVKIWEKALEATTKGVKTSYRRISPKKAQKNTAENGGGKYSILSIDGQYYNPGDITLISEHPNVTVVEIEDARYQKGQRMSELEYSKYRSEQTERAVENYGVYVNKDTVYSDRYGKIRAEFGQKAVNKARSYGGTAIYDILPHIGEIFENAVVVETKPDRKNDTNIRGIVDLAGGAILGDGSLAVVKLNVIEYANNEAKIYDNRVIEIEELTVVGGVGHPKTGGSTSPAVSSEIIISAYRNFVNKKYSLELSDETDSQGNQLSEGQKAYFADSKVRDAQGKLIPVYHGTGALFNEFSFDFINTHGSSEGRGFYFTDSRSMAEGYSKDSGRVMAGYLDIKKPLSNYERTISRQEVTRLIKAIDPTGDDLLANYDPTGGMGYPSQAWYNRALRDTVDIIMQNETDSDLLAEIANGGAGNAAVMQAAHDLLGYDGYIEQNKYDGASVYVALDSSQFKDLDNKNPTSSKDTRYSMEGSEFFADEVMEAQEVEDATKRQLEYLRKQIAVTKDATADPKSVERIAGNLITSYGVELDKSDIAQDLQVLYDHILRGDNVDYWAEATDIARKIAESITETEGDIYTEYADLRKELKARGIYVSESVKNDIANYFDTVRPYRNRLKLSTKDSAKKTGSPVDVVYTELASMYPYMFPEDVMAESDMLLQILDVTDRIYDRGAQRFLDSQAVQDATSMIAGDIIQRSYDLKQFKNMKELRQESKQAQKDATLAGMMAQGRVDAEKIRKVKQRLEQVRKDKSAAIQTIKRRDARIERMQESASVKKYRARVEQKAKKLTDALLKNSDKEHIPEALKQVVGGFVNSIDFSSQKLIKKGVETKRDLTYTQTLSRLKDVLSNQFDAQTGIKKNEDGTPVEADYYLDLPDGFASQIAEHIHNVEDAARGWDTDTNQVYSMSAAQLKDLDFILTVLNHSISKINTLTENGRFESAREAARNSILDLNATGGKMKANTKFGEKVGGFAFWDSATPFYAFQRFGEGGKAIFEGLQNGWDRLAENTEAVIQFARDTYTEEEVKEWGKEIHEVTLQSGETVKMTTAQIMSFYCLAKREQAVGHLLGGGIRISAIQKSMLSNIDQTKDYILTRADVENIAKMLTDRQIAVADAMQGYMNTTGSDWGNEVSLKRFGYKAFTENDYFPIASAPANLKEDIGTQGNDMFRLLNLSMTKSLTQKANNALVVSDIFDVFAAHMSDMAKYNALAMPILDAMKWYNYKDTMRVGETQIKTQTVKKSLEAAYGSVANKYFLTFMKDLNGKREVGRSTDDSWQKKWLSNYKIAAVGANLRVALLQPTAYVRAVAVIDPKYMAQGLAMKSGVKEMEANSGIAKWKGMGFYDTNIGRGIREQIKSEGTFKDKLVEKSMWAAEKGDQITWGAIWNACKAQVKDQQGLSGQELLDATSKVFRDVVYQTQVVDSTMTRSHKMRDTSFGASMTNAFMAEPTLSYNMLTNAVFNYVIANKSGRIQAAKKVGRVMGAFCLTTLASSIAESIFDAWRDDDDYEKFYQKFLEAFGENVLDNLNPLNMLPIAKDIMSMLDGYDVARMDMVGFQNLIDAFNLWGGNWETSNRTLYGRIYKSLQALSQVAGLPASNLVRETVSLWNNTIAKWFDLDAIKTYDPGAKKSAQNAYMSGYISEAEARKALVNDAQLSADDAGKIVAAWQFAKEYPEYEDLADKAAALYITTLKDLGVDAGSFYTAYKTCNAFTAENENGETVNGLKKKRVLQYLKTLTGSDAKYIRQAILQLMGYK